MKHPLTQLRENLGLDLGGMAEALGVSYHCYYRAERTGAGLPRAARGALADLGVDVADLERRLREWRDDRARELRAELRERMATAGVSV